MIKRKRGAAARRLIAGKEPYEISYFQRNHNISREETERIIRKKGIPRKGKCRSATAPLVVTLCFDYLSRRWAWSVFSDHASATSIALTSIA